MSLLSVILKPLHPQCITLCSISCNILTQNSAFLHIFPATFNTANWECMMWNGRWVGHAVSHAHPQLMSLSQTCIVWSVDTSTLEKPSSGQKCCVITLKTTVWIIITVKTSNLTGNLLAMKGVLLASVSCEEYSTYTVSVKTASWNVNTEIRMIKLSLCILWRYRESRGITPLILNLGHRWGWVVSFMLQSLDVWYPMNRRLGGPHSWSRHFGEKSLASPGIQTLIIHCWTHSLVTILTELSWTLPHWDEMWIKTFF